MFTLRFFIVLTLCLVVLATPSPEYLEQRDELPKRQLKQLKLKRGDEFPSWNRHKPPKPSKTPHHPHKPHTPYRPFYE